LFTIFGGAGVLEVVEDDAGDTYRAIYTVIRLTSGRTTEISAVPA
jgi:phage-related protein